MVADNPEIVTRLESLAQPQFGQVAKRYAFARAAQYAWRERPLAGFGPGCFKHAYGKHMARSIPESERRQFTHTYSEEFAHDDFVQALAEGGALGFGFLAWLLWAAARRAATLRDRLLGRTLLASGTALLVHAASNYPFHIAPTAMLFWVGVGVLGVTPGRAAAPAPRTVRAAAGLVPLAAGLLAALIFAASLYTRLGKDLVAQERWSGVRAAIERSALVNWDDRREAFFAGGARFQQGDVAGAVELFLRETDRNPYYMDGFTNLGSAYGMLKDLGRAREAFARAIELNPAYAEAYANLGVAWLEERRWGEAADAFARALDLEPDLPLARNGMALALKRGGR
jgi:tetratricopeptide (TPR) repeat protein